MSGWRSRRVNGLVRVALIALLLATSAYLLTKPHSHASIPTSPMSDGVATEVLPTGWPVVTQHDANHSVQFLHNRCYDVGYSNDRVNPLWVVYKLTDRQDGQVDKRQAKFIMDDRTSAKAVHEYYNRSGYDRGHMAPNHAIAELCDDEAQKETFFMSNITPQSKALNQRWWERLERVELTYFTHIFKEVWVIDGPVFGSHPVLLPNGPVQVPEACYKIFIARKNDQWHVLAFLVDQGVNGDEALSRYRVRISDIEQRVGLDLLPNLPDDIKMKLDNDMVDPIWNLADVDRLPSHF
jgi:endonuclease G